ncbi:MAG: Fic family protein [Pseudomonadota bacterium]
MSADPYEVFDDPYCYKGTSVLKNKARLRDEQLLSDFELEMTTLRAGESFPQGGFDPQHYCAVHHHLFQDVYTWAGKYRTVRTAKGGNPFCFPEYIDAEMNKLFRVLRGKPFLVGESKTSFVGASAHFLAELNVIHCFREGNGRAQLSFLHMIGSRAGHELRLELARPATFLPAMINSFSGKLGLLERELKRLVR